MKSCKFKSIVFFLAILFVQQQLVAQLSPIDSLIDLSRRKITSEELLSVNNQIGDLLKQAYPDSAIRYYNRSLSLAVILKSNEDYVDALSNIGVAWGIKNVFDSANFYTHKSIELSKEFKYKKGVARGFNNLGLFELRKRNYQAAFPYFFNALDNFKKAYDRDLESKIYNNLGLAYKRIHKYDSALYFYLESLKIKEAINDLQGIGVTTSNVALVYEQLGDYDLSIKYLERSLIIRQNLKDKYGQAIVYNNIGLLFEHKQQPDSALVYYLQALALFERMDRKDRISACYNNIGSTYAQLKDFKKGIDYLNKSLKISIEAKDTNGQANSYLDMAEFYAELKNYSKSIRNYKLSIYLADRINNFDLKIDGFNGLYLAYDAIGEGDSALHYYRSMIEFKDSLKINESKERVELLEIQYQTLKKEKENQELVKVNQISRERIKQGALTAILLAVLLFFFIITTIVILRNRNKIKKAMEVISVQKGEIEKQATKLELTYTEMKDLLQFKEEMTGMIVHDLKNPINTIINIADAGNNNENTLLVKHSAKRMLNLVMNILDIQRYEDAGFELKKQNTELRYVFYKVFEEVKYNAQLKAISINIPKAVDYIVDIDVPVFERVLVNLLTNALKFSPENSSIDIKYELLSKTHFKIHIVDKGPGINREQLSIIFHKYKQAEKRSIGYAGSTGIGLTFCKMAVESHNGQIGVDSRATLGSDFWIKLEYKKRIFTDKQSTKSTNDVEELELFLSYHVKELLKPHVLRVSEYLVYQISDIRKELAKLKKFEHQTVAHYVDKLNDAVLACDEKRYKNLINLVLDSD